MLQLANQCNIALNKEMLPLLHLLGLWALWLLKTPVNFTIITWFIHNTYTTVALVYRAETTQWM